MKPGDNVAEDSAHDEASAAQPKAPALSLDRSKIQVERRVATERLLARLKAIDATQEAQTPRAYASRYIREQEPVILRLLDAGVGTDEILADLAMSFRRSRRPSCATRSRSCATGAASRRARARPRPDKLAS